MRDTSVQTKEHTHPDNRTKYAPWYHLNSRKDAHSLPRNAGQTEQLNEHSAVLLQSDLLLPRRGACTDRTLSKRAKEKYSSFSWHLCINFNIIAVKLGFVKGYPLFSGTDPLGHANCARRFGPIRAAAFSAPAELGYANCVSEFAPDGRLLFCPAERGTRTAQAVRP